MARSAANSDREYQCPRCFGQFFLGASLTEQAIVCPHCQENVPLAELTPMSRGKSKSAAAGPMDLDDFLADAPQSPPLPTAPTSASVPSSLTANSAKTAAAPEPFEIPSLDKIVFREPVEGLGGLIDNSQLSSAQRGSVHFWRNLVTALFCLLMLVGVLLAIHHLR
jgi:DNA-directed RNA polymerase subunit RPC12/RpoP